MRTGILLLALATLPCASLAQWDDVQQLGTGGESYVSTDGAGTVYVTCHLPTELYQSRDFGLHFKKVHTFADSLGDVVNMALPDGKLMMSYMASSLDGVITQHSFDFASNFVKGQGVRNRPLDREWMVFDQETKIATMIYSDGYIGGPRSKGVFISQSKDYGDTWTEVARVDKEPAGSFGIDPHIAIASDGKIYGFWNTSEDYDHVNNYRVAVSTDHGKSFAAPITISSLPRSSGDTQERWMLGGVCAHGDKDVAVFFVQYDSVKTIHALRVRVRLSRDGGATFGAPINVTSDDEIVAANKKIRDDSPVGSTAFDYPVQMMSWGAFDATGRLHVTWMDNRAGRDEKLSIWQVRHAYLDPGKKAFSPSDQVSAPFSTKRPALDFMCCVADKQNLYVTYTANEGSEGMMDFSGKLFIARRPLSDYPAAGNLGTSRG